MNSFVHDDETIQSGKDAGMFTDPITLDSLDKKLEELHNHISKRQSETIYQIDFAV